MNFKNLNVWFVTGSQQLYGAQVLKQVARHSEQIAGFLNDSINIPLNVVFKPVMDSAAAITRLCQEASTDSDCVGMITWCHTFSPSRMWIQGLKLLNKPILHLHTQYNRDLPWDEIDMDFMNLNQSAHGDREHGYIMSRLRLDRKVVVGHWQEADVQDRIAAWSRAAAAWHDMQNMKIARFGDNMREVAVTEGDKVEAQIRLGFSVNGYGVGDVAEIINGVSEEEIDQLIEEYSDTYIIAEDGKYGAPRHKNVRYQARLELGIKRFLTDGGFKAYTDTFEDLHGLEQLPGLATQRLMAAGFGFGAEGDWKHAALVRALKVMGAGLNGGCSFMEDYTYHLHPAGHRVLGAHMLEICPSIASDRPKLEVHPLGIGGKDDPARLVFTTPAGPAVTASLVDMGNRFRMIVNRVECVDPPSLPRLPLACSLWTPQPDLKTAAAAWIYAGGAHHTAFSQALTAEHLEDFAAMAGIEFLNINEDTKLSDFKKELRWNEVYYHLNRGF